MERKVGKTGLTQKEAVFEIIKNILGPRYNPKVSVEQMFARKVQGALRPCWNPREINPMIALVAEGLRDGSVPSKYNSTSSKQQVKEYANRITHYWMKHDKRLNGDQVGTRMATTKKKQIVLLDRVKTDPMLDSLRTLMGTLTTGEDRQEVQIYISSRLFEIILETFSIDLKAVPQVILHEMGILPTLHEDSVKKEAA